MTGEFIAGIAIVLFIGFIANRLGFLSVHKRADKPISGAGGGSSKTTTRTQRK